MNRWLIVAFKLLHASQKKAGAERDIRHVLSCALGFSFKIVLQVEQCISFFKLSISQFKSFKKSITIQTLSNLFLRYIGKLAALGDYSRSCSGFSTGAFSVCWKYR